MVAEAKKGFRGKPRIVLTGGAAPLFAVLADDGWISDEYILLKGAASFAMRTGTDG
jgi:pantothenate kinase type III